MVPATIHIHAMQETLELPSAARRNLIPELLQLLKAPGSDVNEPGPEGFTALHWAASNGHPQAVTLLLTYNAQIDIETPSGHKAWQLAEDNGHAKIVKALKAHAQLLEALAETDSDDSNEPVAPAIIGSRSMDTIKPIVPTSGTNNKRSRGKKSIHALLPPFQEKQRSRVHLLCKRNVIKAMKETKMVMALSLGYQLRRPDILFKAGCTAILGLAIEVLRFRVELPLLKWSYS